WRRIAGPSPFVRWSSSSTSSGPGGLGRTNCKLAGRSWSPRRVIRSEWDFLPGAYLLPDHCADFLVKPLSFVACGGGRVRRDGMCPNLVSLFPCPARIMHPVEDGPAGFLGKLDCHLAILLTLVKADAESGVGRNDVGVGGSRPNPPANPLSKAGLV